MPRDNHNRPDWCFHCRPLRLAQELVHDKSTGEAFDPAYQVGPYCADRAEAHGVILRASGDTIAFGPPLGSDKQEIGELIVRFRHALDDTLAMVQEQGWRSAR